MLLKKMQKYGGSRLCIRRRSSHDHEISRCRSVRNILEVRPAGMPGGESWRRDGQAALQGDMPPVLERQAGVLRE